MSSSLRAVTLSLSLLLSGALEASCHANPISDSTRSMAMFQSTTTRQQRPQQKTSIEEELTQKETAADRVEKTDHQEERLQAGLLAIPLQRVYSKSFIIRSLFLGNITIGHPPQKFSVVFDTTSGHVLLPHKVCRRMACMEHRRYSSVNSLTSEDVEPNGARIQKAHRLAVGRARTRDSFNLDMTFADFGKGTAETLLVRDRVCLSGANRTKVCSWPAVHMAIHQDKAPFLDMPGDGIIGLGLAGLGISPQCSFFQQLVEKSPKMVPQFGFSLGQHGGVLYVGGHGKEALAAPLKWFPVHSPEEGFWQVQIHAVRVGNITVDNCEKGCHAFVDTSASRLDVQKSNLPKLLDALTPRISRDDGKCIGPELQFDLGGMVVSLGADDYTSESFFCNPDLGSLDLDEPEFVGVYSFGDIVLQHYSIAFNWKDKTIGFALSAREVQKVGSAQATTAELESIFM